MYSKEDLINKLQEVAQMLGKEPSIRDMRAHGITDDPYYRIFGSFQKAKDENLGKEWTSVGGLTADSVAKISNSKKTDALLEELRKNLSDEELKAIVNCSGGVSSKPRLTHTAYETGYTKFLVVSDTHIGHSKFREDWWDHMVERATRADVHFAFHAGDILEGMSTRPGHVYELDAIGFEAQFAKAKRLIGNCPFPIKAIIGNHDMWYVGKADQGTNVGLRLQESLDNFEYLGADEADVIIENIRIKLWHGSDGASYAISYRGQKIVESLDGGDKPHILITGHDHKAIFFQTRNVHIIGAGTLCEQTGFMRGKKLAAHKGYWIVEAWSNEEGLVRIRPEWCPFY